MPNFSGVWDLKDQVQAIAAGRWTGIPTFELYAWGSNGSGRLGDNTIVAKSSPVQIGALTTWSKVSASAGHNAATKTDGTLWIWGSNNNGQLGLEDTINRSSPVQVGVLTTWNIVEVGGATTFVIKDDGSLWSWGWGNSGRTGLNTSLNVSSPTQIGALTNWAKVASSNTCSLAIKSDGTLWSWGGNGAGQLGLSIAPGVNRSSPVQVGALTNWYNIAVGNHALATKTDGTLWSWGRNNNGELGLNNRTTGPYSSLDRSSPVQVGALTDWSFVAGGNDISFATKTSGALWAWGQGSNGATGLNDIVSRSSPVQVGALTNWSQPTAKAAAYAGSTKTDGTLWLWGNNSLGVIGNNTTVSSSSPTQVGASTAWYSASVSGNVLAILQGSSN